MIKIIEHGTIQKLRCVNCGCLFSFDTEDIQDGFEKKLAPTAMELYRKPYRFIACPQCKKEIVLEATR